MFQLSFAVNTNISSSLLFSSREASCIFHQVSFLPLHSYIKGSEDKEPDSENIILLKIYPLILTSSVGERGPLSINYFNALCKRDLLTSSRKNFSPSEIRKSLRVHLLFSFLIQVHREIAINGTDRDKTPGVGVGAEEI